MGKLTETRDGHQYICVIIDYLTKWPKAYPLKTESAAEVTVYYQVFPPIRGSKKNPYGSRKGVCECGNLETFTLTI